MADIASGAGWRGEAYSASAGHHRTYDDWFLDRLSPETRDVVVDLGCGSGEFTARIADLVTGGRVIGIDPDPSMLEVAKKRDHPRTEFVSGAAQQLDERVDESSVDKVLSRAMLHWISLGEYPRVFDAVFRVLRPGGWYHSESAGAGNGRHLTAVLNDLATKFATPPLAGFPDPGVVYDMIEQTGFEIPPDGIRAVTQRRPFTREQAMGLLQSQGSVAIIRNADGSQVEAILEAAGAEVERLRRWDGTFDQTFVRLEILVQKPW